MNVELLEKVKKAILEEPKRLDMGIGLMTAYEHGDITPPACGTVGCIAGWAVVLYEAGQHIEKYQDVAYKYRNHWGSIELRAMNMLDIDNIQANKLFYTGNWPKPLRIAYRDAASDEIAAGIAAEHIDAFIKEYQ